MQLPILIVMRNIQHVLKTYNRELVLVLGIRNKFSKTLHEIMSIMNSKTGGTWKLKNLKEPERRKPGWLKGKFKESLNDVKFFSLRTTENPLRFRQRSDTDRFIF